MLTMINRSIDYSKTSSGISLQPVYETFNIVDITNWVIKRALSTHIHKVPINLVSLPDEISPYLTTDKSWLMENLMCLLSNAQKFTTKISSNVVYNS